MSIGERLKSERLRLAKPQSEVARSCSVTTRTQVNYESGVRLPDAQYLASFASIGGDILYVVTGTRFSYQTATASALALHEPILPPREAALLENYRSADAAGKRALEQTAAALGKPSPGQS
ncbi:MAG: transcriptional regulator [Rhodocyclales bacterium]|nr:transcriptional regulator [Rhodocyclales bacterium]